MRMESEVELLVGGISAAEGPAFDRDGNLFFVGHAMYPVGTLVTS